MVVAAAQSSSIRGDLQTNIGTHLRFIDRAASAGVDLLVFPELSLTGYELDLASTLQLSRDDPSLSPIRTAAEKHEMHIIVGGPLTSEKERPHLGAHVVSPQGTVHYAKIHVHESETPYFLPGEDSCVVSIDGTCVGVAICADTGHASHAATVAARGAQLYVASVMKTDAEILDHARKMKQYAMSQRMAALTANYAGSSGRRQSAGKSAFWDERGHLVARVDSNVEALLVARSKMGHWHGEIIAFR